MKHKKLFITLATTLTAMLSAIAVILPNKKITESNAVAGSTISIKSLEFYFDNEDESNYTTLNIKLAYTDYLTTTILTPKMMLAIYDNEIDFRFSIQNLIQTNSTSFIVDNIEQNASFRYIDEENGNQVSNTLEKSINYNKIPNNYELQNIEIDFYLEITNFDTTTKNMTIKTMYLIVAYFINVQQESQPIIKEFYNEDNENLILNGNYYAGSADFFEGYNFIDKISKTWNMYLYINPQGAKIHENVIYNQGYNAGETIGKNDILNNPGQYNLFTQQQMTELAGQQLNNGIAHGINQVVSNPHIYDLFTRTDINEALEQGGVEVLDLPGLMLNVLSMPFAFINKAFDVTIFPNTPYQINFTNIIKGLIAILAMLFIFNLFKNGLGALGDVKSSNEDRKWKREQRQMTRERHKKDMEK